MSGEEEGPTARGLARLFGAGKEIRSYRSNPLNALELEYEAFRDTVAQALFSSPDAIFAIRRKLMKSLLSDIVQGLYDNIYNLMTEGKDAGGSDVIDVDTLPAKASEAFKEIGGFKPSMSGEKVDKIALDLVAGLEGLLRTKVIDVVVPTNVFDSALRRTGKKAALVTMTGGDEPPRE